MASGISVKMGVTGVAQFKQGMKESQAAVKNLDQQLKLNEAQLKLTGNEELALQNKTALLTKQIEEQKNVVKQANSALETMQRNGVSKTSAEFQKMQQQVYKAATDLMTMQAELQNVGESGEEAQSGVSHMNQALQRIGTNVSFDSVVNGIGKITDSLEAAAKKALDMGRKLLNATLGAGNWADELVTDAKVYGMSPEDLQRMQKTSRIIDTSVEAIVSAKKKMNKGLGSADKEVMGAFAAFGLDPTQMSSVDDKFWAIGDAIYHMANAEEQEVYAQRVFGRGWAELNPLFEAGREEYEKTNAEWNVVSEENLNKLTEMDDAYQKLSSEWETFKMSVLSSLAEGLQPVMETITEMMKQLNEYLSSEEGQAMLSKLSEAIQGMFEDLTNINPEDVIGKVEEIFDSIQRGLNWFINNKQSVYDALKVIAGGFALLKVTELAANIGRVVTGLSGLLGRKGNQMDATQAGRPGGSYGSSATQSGGLLVGIGNVLNGAMANGAAALTAYDPTGLTAMLPYVLQDFTTFGRSLSQGMSLGESAGRSWETIKASASEGMKNFTDYFTKDIQSGMWGILGIKDAADLQWQMEHGAESVQRGLFGSGEEHQYALTEQDMARAALRLAEAERDSAQPMDRMTTVAGEMTGEVTVMRAANENMTAAANELMTMPAEMYTTVYNAIMAGMSNVTIVVDAGCVDTIGERISYGFGNKVVAELQ